MLAEWQSTRLADLTFARSSAVIVAVIVFAGLSLFVAVLRSLRSRMAVRREVALPALLQWAGTSTFSLGRHAVLVLFLVGLPFFAIALAEPYASLSRQDVSFPGRRIALMIDASSSMLLRFPTKTLGPKEAGTPPSAFFTTVAAAEIFVHQRMSGKYRDLIGLIEFGDEAYVITPFTTDYDNILLSLSLVGDWTEFMKFPDQGTTIGLAIEQSVGLFKAFDFLDAAGNLMLIFSDGQDTQVTIHGKNVNEILEGARQTKIPVYFIRTSYNKGLGAVLPDDIWKPAVEATGGKFYPAGDEQAVLNAIKDIDTRSAGRVDVKRYSSQQPKFAGYAFLAASFWMVALTLQLTVPYFRKFP
jgi:Ca-activated chloride channel family protein